jgi:hypothetical protein
MKKVTTILLGLLIASSAALAQTNVLSRNAVGYVKQSIPPGGKLQLVGDPWRNIDGTPRNATNVFTLGGGIKAGAAPNLADSLILWDVVGQRYVIYGMKPTGAFHLKANWAGAASNIVMTPGISVFVQTTAASLAPTNLFTMGEVPGASNYVVGIAGSGSSARPITFIANPYPVNMALNTLINTNQGAYAAAAPNLADSIFVWDVVLQRYTELGLKLNGGGAGIHQWFVKSAWTTTPVTPWSIAPGQGFLYQRAGTRGAFNWNVARPYSWPNQ